MPGTVSLSDIINNEIAVGNIDISANSAGYVTTDTVQLISANKSFLQTTTVTFGSIYVGPTGTASLMSALTMGNASVTMTNLPTYADNTAATGAGLLAGRIYKTASGELRIVV